MTLFEDLLYHTLFIDSLVEMCLGCLHFFIIYSAAMSTHVKFFAWTCVFNSLGCICLDKKLLGNIITPRLPFQKGAKTFSKTAVPLLFPQTMNGWSSFSTSSSTLVIVCSFDYSHPGRWQAPYHYGFDVHFANDWGCKATFHVCWPFTYFPWRSVYFCPLLVL